MISDALTHFNTWGKTSPKFPCINPTPHHLDLILSLVYHERRKLNYSGSFLQSKPKLNSYELNWSELKDELYWFWLKHWYKGVPYTASGW